jgi:predicted transcriptional regulator
MNADQIRAARALLRWSQGDLSERCKVSVPTIKRLEAMDELVGHQTTINAIKAAFEEAGIIFIPENGGGVGVRMAKRTTR